MAAHITLTSYNTGFEASRDYEAWTDFVFKNIDAKCGFEVEVDSLEFGRGFGDTYDGSDVEVAEIREAMRDLWEDFCRVAP